MVCKTKTGHKHPVVLDFDSHMKGAMSFFFKQIRHQFSKTDSGNLFFTSIHGNPLSSSYIGQLMKRSFKKAIGSGANPTKVRKMTSTMIAYESDQVKKQTAALMTHTTATQEKSYTHISLIENNARMTRLLANRRKKEADMLQEKETEESKEEEKDKEVEKDKEEEKESSEGETEVKSEIRKDEVYTPTESSGARFNYTADEQDLLANEFTDILASAKFASRPLIRSRVATTPKLLELAVKVDGSSTGSFPRVVQKVVNMWRKLHKKH